MEKRDNYRKQFLFHSSYHNTFILFSSICELFVLLLNHSLQSRSNKRYLICQGYNNSETEAHNINQGFGELFHIYDLPQACSYTEHTALMFVVFLQLIQLINKSNPLVILQTTLITRWWGLFLFFFKSQIIFLQQKKIKILTLIMMVIRSLCLSLHSGKAASLGNIHQQNYDQQMRSCASKFRT